MSALELVDTHREHLGGLDESTNSKTVDTTIFTFAGDPPDQALLAALVAHYQHETLELDRADSQQDVWYGPSRSDAVTAVTFDEVARHDAQTVLEQWVLHETSPDQADEDDQDDLVLAIRSRVFSSFAGDAVYRVAHLDGPAQQHDWRGFGGSGAHEYVVVNRTKHHLTLIVAADD